MSILNRKNSLIIWSIVAGAVITAGYVLFTRTQPDDGYEPHRRNARYAAKIIPLLTHDDDIVGEWKGIRSSGELGYGRSFAASGKMKVCYGCYILDGRFQIIDDRTVEIRHRFSGEVWRWTFGFLGDELIMVWKSDDGACRIEEYRRVPVGTHLWAN